jgi:tripeptide aminopeptidase
MTLIERFLNYVSYETTATEEKEDAASNPLIYNLSKQMMRELQALNPNELSINQFGVVDAKFYGDPSKPAIAFLAHMDTSNQASGKDVKPQIIKNYDGKDIKLNEELTLSAKQFPTLLHSIGHCIICTSGDTLLGGDDKAGMAIIMTALSDILEGKKNHRPLEIIFTTDEEIGADAHHVSMESVFAKYGYTVDGGDYRYISTESFTAYSMQVKVVGKSIHPGSAKDKLVNAAGVLMKFHNALPEVLRPEETSEHEPFYHLCNIQGSEDSATGDYIIRSFDEDQMKELINLAKLTARRINDHTGYEAITLEIKEQYHNMKVVLDKYPEIQKEMEDVYNKLGMEFHYEAIRGCTTGSQLSFMGLPCPNLGTGDYNMHGRYEYVDYDEMEAMVNVVKELMIA